MKTWNRCLKGDKLTDRLSQRVIAILVLTGLALVLASCAGGSRGSSGSSASTITYEELPEGLGRGYPVASVDKRPASSAQIRAGEAAPDFALTLEDGRTFTLADLQGRPVMINFWATWCPPCRSEMPDIVEAASGDDELVVIAVNVMEGQDLVQSFAEEYDMHMPVVRDVSGKIRDLYQVRGMPTSIFIDKDGAISSVWAGMLDANLLEQKLDEIR